MRVKVGFVVLSAFMLFGCSCPPVRKDDVPGVIRNVSFMGAHREEHCSKGCSYSYVPDTWFLNVCDKNNDCRINKITNAPWDWQKEGQAVIVHWRTYCSFGVDNWKMKSFEPEGPS